MTGLGQGQGTGFCEHSDELLGSVEYGELLEKLRS